MMRNALGVEEGGSGVPLDRAAYLRSVGFWRTRQLARFVAIVRAIAAHITRRFTLLSRA